MPTTYQTKPPGNLLEGDSLLQAFCRLNKKHFVVSLGGKTVVVKESWNQVMERTDLTPSSFADFRNFYHRFVVSDAYDKPIPLGRYWLEHDQRRQYEEMVFLPGKQAPKNTFNMWRGFSVEPQKGDCRLLLKHIREVVCKGNEEYYNYFMGWCAQGVQDPCTRPEILIALKGLKGSGKSILAKYYRKLFGQHGVPITSTSRLTGSFNSFLKDTIVLEVSEAFWQDNREAEAILKAMITDDTLTIEHKGFDPIQVPNYLRIILTSNEKWVVPATGDERRYFVLEVGSKYRNNAAYFDPLVKQMENQGGLSAFLYELQQFDYSSIDIRRPPDTQALTEQKLHTLDDRTRWLLDKLMRGYFFDDDSGWNQEIPKRQVQEDYRQWMKSSRERNRSSETELGMFLKKQLGRGLRPGDNRRLIEGRQTPIYKLGPLSECRTAFQECLGFAIDWPEEEESTTKPRTVLPAAARFTRGGLR